jgi:hypothetical protein
MIVNSTPLELQSKNGLIISQSMFLFQRKGIGFVSKVQKKGYRNV